MTDSPYFAKRRFQANQVTDVNPSYYLQNNSDVLDTYNKWVNDPSSLHYADYIRTNQDLAGAWNKSLWTGGDPDKRLSRWDRGAWHWGTSGKNEPGRVRPLVVGDKSSIPGETRTIWTGVDTFIDKDYGDSSKNDFAAWHFDTFGRSEGRFGTKKAFYDSPGEVQKRNDARDERLRIEQAARDEKNRLFEEGLEKARVAAQLKIAEGAEYSRLASRRGGGSQTLGASGAATFKGKGLKSSENKRGRGRGTGQFKRPYGTSNLSIAATGKGNQQSNHNL